MPKIPVSPEGLAKAAESRGQLVEEAKAKATKRFQGVDDFLLSDFSEAQREFIVKEVYPSLRQAMMHFVKRAE